MRCGLPAAEVPVPLCGADAGPAGAAAAANSPPREAPPPAFTATAARRGSVRRRCGGSAAAEMTAQHWQPRNDSRRICCFILVSLIPSDLPEWSAEREANSVCSLSPSELGFTRVRHYEWPKSDISDFGCRGLGWGLQI